MEEKPKNAIVKKQVIVSVIALIIIICSLFTLIMFLKGNNISDKDVNENIESREDIHDSPETLTYNGTYDENVLCQLNQDIIIGDEHVSLPCSLEDLGPDFTYLTETASGNVFDIDEINGETAASILWKGKYVGRVWYRLSYEENHDYSKDSILRLYLNGQDLNWSVGGITVKKSNGENIEETLGTPTELKIGENNQKVYNYGINRLQIVVDGSDRVTGFWMSVNTNPSWEPDSEEIPYDGRWHDGTLKQLSRDIVIQGRSFSMPFSVNDLGLGFTLDRGSESFYIREVEELNAVSLDLKYCGTPIAEVMYDPHQDPDHDYRQDPIRVFCPIGKYEFPSFGEECTISIAGLKCESTTVDELTGKLGKPEEDIALVGGERMFMYGNHGFAARINPEGTVKNFYLADSENCLYYLGTK